jgi:hypothetical protein
MPTEPIPGTIPFDLEGMADLARKVSPEVAQQVDSEIGAPPEPTPEPEPEPTPEPEPEPTPEPEPEPTPEPEKSTEDELEELNRQSEAAKAKAAKPPEAPKPPEVPNARDADLKLDERAAATLHPKTKKIIEERNQKIVTERNRADAIAKEKATLAAKVTELEEAAKKVIIPKPVEEELTKLRDRVRELDITHDPVLVEKYDKPITENQGKIIEVLQGFGLGQTVEGKPDPTAIEALKKTGLTFAALAPHIKKLSDAGEEAAAESIREYLRDNIRLGRDKQREVTEWKTNYDLKKQQSQQAQQQTQEKTLVEVREHSGRILREDLAEMEKTIPFIKRPPDPLPTDTPAVTKSKNDAIAAFDAAAQAVADEVAKLDASKAPPGKAAEVYGKVSALSVQAIVLRQHVLPRLTKELTALKARNAELEASVGKIKAAGSLSRAHAALATAPAGSKASLPEDTGEAMKQVAKDMGIAIDT